MPSGPKPGNAIRFLSLIQGLRLQFDWGPPMATDSPPSGRPPRTKDGFEDAALTSFLCIRLVTVLWSNTLPHNAPHKSISLEYTRGGQMDTHRGEKYQAVGGDIHREWDYIQIWRSLSFRVLWSNRLRLTNSLVQVQYNTDTQRKDIDKWNTFVKEKGIPTERRYKQQWVGWGICS